MRRFRPIKISIPLTRLGSDNDGGYLIPDDFGGVVACFSPGVSTNTSFETSLLEKYNVPSYLTDPTLTANQRDEIDKIFDLEDKYLGGCNDRDMFDLENWMQIKGYGACTNYSLVLQMDIEGYEFDVLLATLKESFTKV